MTNQLRAEIGREILRQYLDRPALNALLQYLNTRRGAPLSPDLGVVELECHLQHLERQLPGEHSQSIAQLRALVQRELSPSQWHAARDYAEHLFAQQTLADDITLVLARQRGWEFQGIREQREHQTAIVLFTGEAAWPEGSAGVQELLDAGFVCGPVMGEGRHSPEGWFSCAVRRKEAAEYERHEQLDELGDTAAALPRAR